MKTLTRYTNLAVAIGSVVAAAAISLGCPENNPVANEVQVISTINPSQSYDSTYVGDTIRTATNISLYDETQHSVAGTLNWTSSNPAVVKVIGTAQSPAGDRSPQFVPVSEGDAVITATITSTSGVAAGTALTYKEYVSVAGAPASIKINATPFILQVYQNGVTNSGAYTSPTATVRSASGRIISSLSVNWQEVLGNSVAEFCTISSSASSTCSRSSSGVKTSSQLYYGLKSGTTRLAATLTPIAGRTLPIIVDTANVIVGGGTVIVSSPTLGNLKTLVYVGDAPAFVASVKDAAGATVASPGIQWSTSRPSIASIDQSGKVTALSAGADDDTVTVQALAPTLGITGKFVLTVRGLPVAVTVTPSAISVPIGGTARVYAHYTDKFGNPLHHPGPVQFTSGTETIATARPVFSDDTSGTVTGIAAGDAVLTVYLSVNDVSTIQRTIPIKVLPIVQSIKLQYVTGSTTRDYNAAGESIAQGATAKIVATALDANGTAFSEQFNFSTTATGITIATSGLNTVTITGVTPGTNFPIVITGATNANVSATAKITVTAPTPTGGAATKLTITSTPVNATTGIGGTVQFTANATDVNGVAASGCTIGWNTDASSVASINNSTGLATGAGAGATAVRASCNSSNVGSVAKLTVTDGTYGVTKVAITPKKYDYVAQGGTSQFAATVTQTASGATAPIVWSIDAASTTAGVTIDQTGTVRIPTSGSTTFGGGVKITATAGGQTDIAWLTYGYAGSMRGTITSASTGRYLAGSSATATPSTGGVQVSSVVDDNGQFYLVGLAPGSYTVSVSEQGVASGQVFMNVTVTAGNITPITLATFPIRN